MGQQVACLRHESENPRDKNALLFVADPPGGVWGYLPRAVSHYLAPLAREGCLRSRAKVLRLGANVNAAITVMLEVRLAAYLCSRNASAHVTMGEFQVFDCLSLDRRFRQNKITTFEL